MFKLPFLPIYLLPTFEQCIRRISAETIAQSNQARRWLPSKEIVAIAKKYSGRLISYWRRRNMLLLAKDIQ